MRLERLERILDALGARANGKGRWIARCPAHADSTPSLSITVRNGKVLLYCFAGCSTESILQAMGMEWGDLFLDDSDRPISLTPFPLLHRASQKQEGEDRRWKEKLLAMWEEAFPLHASPQALAYLEGRGLTGLPPIPGLRYHPKVLYQDGEEKRYFPALLARVDHPLKGLVALHRTYLDPGGEGRKASIPSPKKLTPPTSPGGTVGGWITLIPLSREAEGKGYIVAEGIETALSYWVLRGMPDGWGVIASISAMHMERMEVDHLGVSEVEIATDHDPRGYQASLSLVSHLAQRGIRGRIALPPLVGGDWNDVLRLLRRA